MEVTFFGFGAATGVGPEQPTQTRMRKLKSTSGAFCDACERNPVTVEREPMGFAIPKRDEP